MSEPFPPGDAEPFVEQYQNIATILDNLDALVYVADMQTHELLYVNRYGQAVWGDARGRKCWQLLQANQSGPCDFCNNAQLLDAQGQPAPAHVWEFCNTSNGRWYQCRDQAIRWADGRLVRLEIATDISARKALEEQLQAAATRAESLARTDELTGLNNRRAFFDLGARHFAHDRRARPMAVIMFDIDRFKRVNDTHGHDAGDRLLKAVADAVQAQLREQDVLGRLGGEEFSVILGDTGLAQALMIAERLRAAIAATVVEREGMVLRCAASFGVSACDDGSRSLDVLLGEADDALFAAKRAGRNRVACFGG